MVVFNQFCALLLGIHLLGCVQCQRDSCTLEEFRQSDMFDEHFDLSNLAATYTLGKSVRVPCQVGYRGFFRLVCSDRGWTKHGAICKKVLCGHPGDVQFADFQLVKGTDYDFGSRVQYTCHKGYQMTSYTSTRNCLERGWDGHLPECEPISCPSLTVDRNVLVYGDMDQATSGSVLQFSCSSRNDELDGPTQLICDDNGNWDKSPPRCRAISCSVPPLENFIVEGEKQEYKKDEFLTYNCNFGYRKMDGRPSQCKKVGQSSQWAPMPRCEEIKCNLDFNPPAETTYNPNNAIIFEVGKTVNVSCGEKYWVKNIELQSAELTCLVTGDWDFQPLCRPVTCFKNDERIKHVYSWQWTSFNTVDMDETLTYQCQRNYFRTSPRATCTRRGWEPNPLCEVISCTKPPLKNFTVEGVKTEYTNNEVLPYSCDYGYRKVPNEPTKCKEKDYSSQWIPAPQCEEITCKLSSDPRQETTYNPLNQIIFRVGQTVNVSCGEKHWVKSIELQSAELTCLVTGDWDFEPLCQQVTCSNDDERFKHVPKWQGTEFTTINMDETLAYQCQRNYFETSPRATCTRRGWEPNPLCEEILCSKPPLQKFVVEGQKTVYKNNEVLTYSCDPGYRKVDQRPPRCQKEGHSSQWIPMPRCEEITCKLSSDPPLETTYNPQNQIIFGPGQTVNVSCGKKHWVKNIELQSAELTCLEDTGDWDFNPVCQEVKCLKGAGHVIYWGSSESGPSNLDDTVSYQCATNYVKTSLRATCTRGGWEPKLLCEEILCPKPPLQNFEVEGEKTEFRKGEFLTYSCNPGYRKVDKSPSQCKIEGNSTEWIPAPKCELITCKLDSNPSEEATDNRQNKTIFRPGETVTVSCGENRRVNSTCQDTGDWDFEPVCKPVTCHKHDALHVYDWQHPSRIIVNLGETLRYQCYSRYRATSPTHRATCTRRGWDPNPLCKHYLDP